MTKRRNITPLFVILAILLSLPISTIYSQEFLKNSHLDKENLPKGCKSCHKGHGAFNTPMLSEKKDKFCFRCHGYYEKQAELKFQGYLREDIQLSNIEKEFEKPYHHPIEKTGIHKYNEILPEINPSMERHAECGDCHHHHYVKKSDVTYGIKGVDSQGAIVQQINNEYELCFKCHSNSANLPSEQTNKIIMFRLSNPSYHPIIGSGTNNDVPSLIPPLDSTSIIKCTDCHSNHGSDYENMLKRNFNKDDGLNESEDSYKLCYQCHNRNLILSNIGFLYHSLHISVVKASCRTCHNPHGSLQYTHLIDFSSPYISHSEKGYLNFLDLGNKTGQCSLKCHGKNHDAVIYP